MEAAFIQLAEDTRKATSVPDAQKALLGVIHTLFDAKASFLTQYFPDKEQLDVIAVRGRNDPRIRACAPGEGPIGTAFSQLQPVRDDGLIAVRIGGADEPLGCLAIVGARHDVSDTILAALAAQVATGWTFARLRDDMARRNKDLQTAVAGLKALEKNREELLSHVSHDLKNPLTTIKAYLAMLGKAKLGELPEKAVRAVETCDRNADRLLRMISDLLLISRLQSGKMDLTQRPFGLREVTEDVVNAVIPAAERVRVSIRLKRGAEVFVRGDRERLMEALHNLIDAAVHFSQPSSTVVVSIHSDSAAATLQIRDGGTGLTPEETEHLFDPYYQPRTGASQIAGLALPIVARIVQLHGGKLEAHSKPGEGSTFLLALPVFAGAVHAPPERERRSGGVLLVEDDADCREVLQQVLEEEGYRVLAVPTASEARAMLETIRPGIVLLDLRLRDEDGRSVLRFIRQTEALRELPVYLISGASELASLGSGVGDERVDGFFEKPLQLPKLLDTVAAAVRPTRAAKS